MKENVVHITVGVLFDLYVKDLIKKETYDDCIRAYKEHQKFKEPKESKSLITVLSNSIAVSEGLLAKGAEISVRSEAGFDSTKPYLATEEKPNYKEAYEDVLDQCEQFITLFSSKGASDEAIDLLSKRIDKVRNKIQRTKG